MNDALPISSFTIFVLVVVRVVLLDLVFLVIILVPVAVLATVLLSLPRPYLSQDFAVSSSLPRPPLPRPFSSSSSPRSCHHCLPRLGTHCCDPPCGGCPHQDPVAVSTPVLAPIPLAFLLTVFPLVFLLVAVLSTTRWYSLLIST